MSKTLVIAEKSSVAADLAKALAQVLGTFEKQGTGRDIWFANDRAIITSAVGHLVELQMPLGPNGKKLPWSFDVLPTIPETFTLQAKEETETRLKQVLRLARQKDVEWIVNACDAGREGELIFRYIMEFGNIHKPVKRLWMQSMTRESILDAWSKLRDGEEMRPLADAAKCRSESDWLVGLNATRALTAFRSRHGGFNITPAGRVQTPTLAILAQRESEIRSFVPASYHEVVATFSVQAGTYSGKWIDPVWKKDAENSHARPERIWDRALADAIRARCEGKDALVEEEKKQQTQIAPQLYDLTTLQREAPFSAKQTLSIAQALYEKHKVLTYPRTDSRCLPEDYIAPVQEALGAIAAHGGGLAGFARAILHGTGGDGPSLHKSRRVFDNKKVSDHFAIIPTGKFARLSDAEQKVFDMVVRRFMAVFYPPAEFEATKRLSHVDHPGGGRDTFRTDGRVLLKPGWLEVYGRKAGMAAGKDDLVAVRGDERAAILEIERLDEETKPPARFNESTLLSAMEGAGKLVDDEALAEAMAERGLGTSSTRAQVIEGLLAQRYIVRDGEGGKSPLHVTARGMRLIELLDEMGVEGLNSPSLTGDWEFKLRQMEHGQLPRDRFMAEIADFAKGIVVRAKAHLEEVRNKEFPDLQAPCPKCQAESLRQTDAMFECRVPGCGFRLNKHIAGRALSVEEASQLLRTGLVGPLEGFKSRFNKPFEAAIQLDQKFKAVFVFENEAPPDQPDLGEETLVAKAVLPDGREVGVHCAGKQYIVPGIEGENGSEIRFGRVILQQEITPDQAVKIVTTGKSDLLSGFVSNRTKRAFSAFLKLDGGKVGFEFQERKDGKSGGPPRKRSARKPRAK